MSATSSRRSGNAPRGVLLAGLCLGAWGVAVAGAGSAPGLYHGGYDSGRAAQAGLVADASVRADGASGVASLGLGSHRAFDLGRSGARDCLVSSGAAGDGAVRSAGARSVGRRSPAKAIGASLLIPGWGQHITGHDGRATGFLVTEAALIASCIGFRIQGEVRQERYAAYAEQFAGVQDADGKLDGYYRNLGRYMNTEEYEDDLARDARARFGNDIAEREAYVDARRPKADEAWQWESTAHRATFTQMRRDSRGSFHRADQVIGVILLNHVLSAVDAGRLARMGASGKALYVCPSPDGATYVGLAWPLDE